MKRIVCLLTAMMLFLCGCAQPAQWEENLVFTETENTKLLSSSGIEYTHLAYEGELWYFGETEFVGAVEGEEEYWEFAVGYPIKNGLFAIKGYGNDVLIRKAHEDEWTHVYRKSTLRAFDFSVDNCVRLEFIPGSQMYLNHEDATHTTCKGGISNKKEIARFLSDIRSQEKTTAERASLYGMIYGFFKEEPNLAVPIIVWSHSDKTYSVQLSGEAYMLPETWLQKLQDTVCTP